jgi:ankyrin repeat protein
MLLQRGQTALMKAAAAGHTETIEALVELGSDLTLQDEVRPKGTAVFDNMHI